MSDNIDIPVKYSEEEIPHLSRPFAIVTPEVQARLIAPAMRRIEQVRQSTDEMLTAVALRVGVLEEARMRAMCDQSHQDGDVRLPDGSWGKPAVQDAAPDCRKDVSDAWRNCPILSNETVSDIYHTALGQVLREQDQRQVGLVVSLAYHLGRENERRPVDSDKPAAQVAELQDKLAEAGKRAEHWQEKFNKQCEAEDRDGMRLMALTAEIASLREKLREAITAIGATAGDRDRLAAQVAELTRERDEHSKAAAGLCGRNIALEEQRDRALAELAALDSPSGFGNCDALHGLTLLEKAQKCMRVIRKNPHAGMVEQQQHEIGRLSAELAAERERARIATAGHEKWHAEAMQLKERAESDRRVSDTLMEAAKQATRERDAARADADKYKAELERHIGMLLGCVKERDRALTELAEARSNRESWKLAAVLGSVGDIPVGSTADDVKRIACQSADALRAELADSRKRWEQRAQDDKFSLEKMGRALAAERERREKAERTMLRALAPDPALAAARAEIERLRDTGGSLRFGTSQLPCSKEVEGAVQATFFELNNRIQRAEAELRQRDENQAMQEGVISKLNAQLKEAESRYALAKGGWDGANQRAERAEAAMERGDYASSAVERELRASLIEEQKANNRLQRELDEVRSRSNQVQGVIRGGIIDFSGAPQTRSSTTPILPPPQTKDPLVLALMRVPLPNDRGTWFLYEENAMRLAAALRSGLISEELKEVNGRLAALQVTANELVGLLDAAHEDVPGHTILWTKIRDALTSYREKYPC